jgi:AcrR family transcriptional regulator
MPPRRRPPASPQDAEAVRAHLLDAALTVFAERGYQGARVRDIAAEADVAAGLLYHYFPSKEAVLRALFERSTALVLEAFSRVASVAAPRERFAALLRESATLVREHREFWRVSYGVRMQHAVVADLSQGIAAQSAAYVGLFTTLLAELGERAPELEAHLLFATLDGVFQHYVLAPDTFPLDAVIERLVERHAAPPREQTP